MQNQVTTLLLIVFEWNTAFRSISRDERCYVKKTMRAHYRSEEDTHQTHPNKKDLLLSERPLVSYSHLLWAGATGFGQECIRLVMIYPYGIL